MQGVYAIVNRENGKMYIGSARNIETRWHQHRSLLRGKRHHSFYLQRAWDKHGESAFLLQVLERVDDVSELRAVEQRWIDFLGGSSGDYGYNVHPVAAGGQLPGWTPPPTSLAKQRDGRRRGEGNTKAKLTEEQVKEICARYVAGETIRQIAPDYGVNMTNIARIVRGEAWKHVDVARLKHSLETTGKLRRDYRLTVADVATIKIRLECGESQSVLAREYGVSSGTISNIATGRRKNI